MKIKKAGSILKFRLLERIQRDRKKNESNSKKFRLNSFSKEIKTNLGEKT